MVRLTKKMPDGSYQANNDPELPGENSYAYKNLIISRCGILEDALEDAVEMYIKVLKYIEESNIVQDFLKEENKNEKKK